jgi:hypothetical protein
MQSNKYYLKGALKRDTDTKSVSNKHMRGCLRPSIWTSTAIKNFLIIPLKATIFQKFPFTIYIEILSFAPHYRQWWQAAGLWQADHQQNLVCKFLPASPVGRADRSRKIGGLTVPVEAAIHFFHQGADHIQLKSGEGIPEIIKKSSHAPGIKFICGPGQ